MERLANSVAGLVDVVDSLVQAHGRLPVYLAAVVLGVLGAVVLVF